MWRFLYYVYIHVCNTKHVLVLNLIEITQVSPPLHWAVPLVCPSLCCMYIVCTYTRHGEVSYISLEIELQFKPFPCNHRIMVSAYIHVRILPVLCLLRSSPLTVPLIQPREIAVTTLTLVQYVNAPLLFHSIALPFFIHRLTVRLSFCNRNLSSNLSPALPPSPIPPASSHTALYRLCRSPVFHHFPHLLFPIPYSLFTLSRPRPSLAACRIT